MSGLKDLNNSAFAVSKYMSQVFNAKVKNENQIDISKFDTLDMFFRLATPIGSSQAALTNNLYGINHQNIQGTIPEDRDSQGLVFFTRPCLNLTTGNLRNVRQMSSLLTTNPNSIQRYVRCMLDPRTHLNSSNYSNYQVLTDTGELTEYGEKFMTKNDFSTDQAMIHVALQELQASGNPALKGIKNYQNYINPTVTKCPFVDEELAFMPLLSNTIKSLKGWPDPVLPNFTSKEGLKKEQWGIGDGSLEIYNSFDLDAQFRNIRDKPTLFLFETWVRYISLVFEGMLDPYFDFLIENEIDYNTRIYRLVLDESKTFVKMISACGAAFPMAIGIGSYFDYDSSQKYNTDNRDLSIRFQCFGAMYNDDILIKEFNETVGIFNSNMKKFMKNPNTNHGMVEIPYNLLHLFNNRGYPYIDPNTMQLKWYISTASKTYQEVIKYYAS